MKVHIRVEQTVEYDLEVKMTAAELADWDNKIKDAGRFGEGRIAEDLLEKYGREHGAKLGDPSDWGELTLDIFEPIEVQAKPKKRTTKNRGEK